MSSAIKLNIDITFSRELNLQECKEFYSITKVYLRDFSIDNSRVINLEGTEFEYPNYFRLKNTRELTYEFPEPRKNMYFFIETLMYLIEFYFEYINIFINGKISGYDEIFGTYFSYKIINNKIYLDYETTEEVFVNNQLENLMENFNVRN